MLFEATADGLLLVDEAGRIVLANPALCRLLGYRAEELSGLEIEALVPPRYRTHHPQMRRKYANQPKPRPMGQGQELVVLHRDGRELPVDIGLSPLRAEGKNYTLATLYDAARRRRMEATLQISEERLQLAKRAAGLAVYDYDLVSGTIHWDEHMHVLWGIGRNEPLTRDTLLAGIHPEDRGSRQAAMESALDPTGNGQYATEYRVISRNDGLTRWVSARGQAFFKDGRALRLVGVVRDITERKIAEEKIQQQRAEMELLVKNQIAAQTASAIAHELNQPLVAISAYSESALRMLQNGNKHPHNLLHALEGSVQQAHRAGRTLHELLGFLQGGQTESAPMYLNAAVREAIIAINREGYGGFQPQLDLEAKLPHVLGNRIQVQKVLDNLLRNGIEAIREAGMPPATASLLVRTRREGNMAQVTVQDQGRGINAETAEHIFDPFFTTKSKGIGMGLAISRALIEALGGRLWADLESGSGATFHFTLPIAR